MNIQSLIPRRPLTTGLLTAAVFAASAAPSVAATHHDHDSPPIHHQAHSTPPRQTEATVLLTALRDAGPVLVSGTV